MRSGSSSRLIFGVVVIFFLLLVSSSGLDHPLISSSDLEYHLISSSGLNHSLFLSSGLLVGVTILLHEVMNKDHPLVSSSGLEYRLSSSSGNWGQNGPLVSSGLDHPLMSSSGLDHPPALVSGMDDYRVVSSGSLSSSSSLLLGVLFVLLSPSRELNHYLVFFSRGAHRLVFSGASSSYRFFLRDWALPGPRSIYSLRSASSSLRVCIILSSLCVQIVFFSPPRV